VKASGPLEYQFEKASFLNGHASAIRMARAHRETRDASLELAPAAVHIHLAANPLADGKPDGLDIQPFVNALLYSPTDPAAVYIADFDGSGAVDPPDLSPFVTALLSQ